MVCALDSRSSRLSSRVHLSSEPYYRASHRMQEKKCAGFECQIVPGKIVDCVELYQKPCYKVLTEMTAGILVGLRQVHLV